MDSWTMTTSGISWTMVTIDDARISKTLIEPIITIERNGDQWGNVIVHKTAEELEQIIRDNSGPLGGLARLALEILRLRPTPTSEEEILKAVFIKDLDGFTGHASLYKLSEEVGYGRDWNEPKYAGYTRYVIVSATDVMDGPETYIFPADENGRILCWQELPGSYRGGLDHAEALRRMGAILYGQRG